MQFLKTWYLGETLFKTYEICIHATLAETFMWAKFQVKIRNYSFAAKVR